VSGFNYEALAVFLRLGFFLGDETAWANRRIAAPPGMNDVARTTLWDTPQPVATVRDRTRSELVDTYTELFREAVSRWLPAEPFALPISGGADSRHILLELVRQGCPPQWTLTAQSNAFNFYQDVASARVISEYVSVPHRTVPVRLSYEAELEKNELTDFQADEHGWVPPLARALQEVTIESFDGIGGGVLSAGSFLSPERLKLATDPEQLAEHLMGSEESLRRVLAPDFYELVPRDIAKSAIVAEYERWRHEANPIGAFFFRNRTRREIALQPFTLMYPTAMHTPYLDPDLVSFLRTIPAEELVGHTLHREVIHTAFPDSRHVPFAKDRVVSRPRRLLQKLHRMTSVTQLALEATKSPRLSRLGGLVALGSRTVWPVVLAERMAWIAQLPTSCAGTSSSDRHHGWREV
jgi:asparagine synthase (glutamine-hydrolysing)